MQDSHLRGWAILFISVLSFGFLCYLVRMVRQMHRDHKKIAGGIPVGDIGAIVEKVEQSGEGIRKHISSNHDEIDGELKRIAESAERTQRELSDDRQNQFSEQLARELDAAREVKNTLKIVKPDGEGK